MTKVFSIPHLPISRTIQCVLIALALVKGGILAKEPAAFTPPKSYPESRYEAGWETNPFTLKTAIIVVENASFAEDLVIASVYGNLADPTVVVVNVKTHERMHLRTSQAAGNGMKLDQLDRGTGRRDDMLAIVSLGTETSKVRYGTSYLKQLATAETAKASQSVLQKRQQSLSQHSGSPALSLASAHQQPVSSSAPDVISVPGYRQDALLAAGPVSQYAGINGGSSQAGSSHNDSHSSAPSLVEELLASAQMPLRRYNFRTGDELSIPHPDPQ